MKHFKVLRYADIDELAEAVEIAINDGWELHGPIIPSQLYYNQAITKVSREDYKGWKDCVKPGCNEYTVRGSNYCNQHKPKLGAISEELPIG